jgi:hypothetical protein
MTRVDDIPSAVLACVLPDGSVVAERVGQAATWVSDLADVAACRKVWEIRGFVDVPIWRDHGTLSLGEAVRWQQYARELLSFIDRHTALGLSLYSFTAARVAVLHCRSTDEAFGVGFPPR